MRQLLGLLKPFSGRLVHPPAKGKFGDYVSHYVVEQRLLAVVGPYSWEITRTILDADGALTGCVGRITATVDERWVFADGAGDVEHPENHATNGSRLKFAESDAFKRAAMRLGVGLHLWAGDEFYVYDALSKRAGSELGANPREGDPASSEGDGAGSASAPSPPSTDPRALFPSIGDATA